MHRFPIGTQYKTIGKHPLLCTVVDHLTTTNSKGEIVAERYVTTHEFCGQPVAEFNVVDTTIARGLTKEFQHLMGA
jgi:hypothetical protein